MPSVLRACTDCRRLWKNRGPGLTRLLPPIFLTRSSKKPSCTISSSSCTAQTQHRAPLHWLPFNAHQSRSVGSNPLADPLLNLNKPHSHPIFNLTTAHQSSRRLHTVTPSQLQQSRYLITAFASTHWHSTSADSWIILYTHFQPCLERILCSTLSRYALFNGKALTSIIVDYLLCGVHLPSHSEDIGSLRSILPR